MILHGHVIPDQVQEWLKSTATETTSNSFKISPNPITNQEIFVKGDLQKVKKKRRFITFRENSSDD